MKKILVFTALLTMVLTANCQSKDKVFNSLIRFNAGIQFGDGTIQTTAATGIGGSVTWDAILNKPLTFAPAAHNQAWSTITSRPTTLSGYGITDAALITHNHSSLYKPLSYIPTWNEITLRPVFSIVALTGNYYDLVNLPDSMELSVALPSLPSIGIPVRTQVQISAMNPPAKEGDLVINSTDTVLQVFLGGKWKIIPTTN